MRRPTQDRRCNADTIAAFAQDSQRHAHSIRHPSVFQGEYAVLSATAIKAAFAVKNLSGASKCVLLVLANHADKHGITHLMIRTLEVETGFSRASVKRALEDLKKRTLILSVRYTRPDGSMGANYYNLSPMVGSQRTGGSAHREPGVGSQTKGLTESRGRLTETHLKPIDITTSDGKAVAMPRFTSLSALRADGSQEGFRDEAMSSEVVPLRSVGAASR